MHVGAQSSRKDNWSKTLEDADDCKNC
jgi:hypothetical protein